MPDVQEIEATVGEQDAARGGALAREELAPGPRGRAERRSDGAPWSKLGRITAEGTQVQSRHADEARWRRERRKTRDHEHSGTAKDPGRRPRHSALDTGRPLRYVRNQWRALVCFVDDGRLAIDNNAAERALRAVAVGRKNWLFTGSPDGGTRAATIYSLVGTCKLLGIEPFEYLRDVIERLPTHPAERVAELTPRNWRAARAAR